MPNWRTASSLVETAHGVVPPAQSVEHPGLGRGGVGQRLQGGERLGADHEEGGGRIEVMGLVVEVDRIDVGYEPALDLGEGVVPQRLVGHGWSEVRSPDADVDHRGDPLAGGAGPGAGPDGLGHRSHPVEDLVDVGDHVLTVDLEGGAAGHPQGHVEHRPVLGGVDVPAGEHGVASLLDTGHPGHRHQGGHGLVGYPVLGVVEVQRSRGHRHPGTPVGIVGEEFTEVALADVLEVFDQS